MMLTLVVPVMVNFKGFAELIHSVDLPIYPIVIDNWTKNNGVAKAWNEGISRSIDLQANRVVITNDDVVFHPGTLQKLIEALDSRIFVTATNSRDFTVAEIESYDNEPDFSCFMIRPLEFVERYGYFDENLYPAYFEDNEMAIRIRLAGDEYNRRLDAGIFHKGSVTQNHILSKPVCSSFQFEKNRKYVIDKWGSIEGKYQHPFNDLNNDLKYWKVNA